MNPEFEVVTREEMRTAMHRAMSANAALLHRADAGETIKIPCRTGKAARKKQIALNQARKRGGFDTVTIARRKDVVWLGKPSKAVKP